jgi:DNA-binding transcriptional ArsR family regulator
MVNITAALRSIPPPSDAPRAAAVSAEEARLDLVFAALSDPIRRQILERLDGEALLVSELATPFDISLQGVSRHIQVLVRAGLVQQERTGRISRCSLDVGPLLDAAVWLNRYTKYWQQQFEVLAATLAQIDARPGAETVRAKKRARASRRK